MASTDISALFSMAQHGNEWARNRMYSLAFRRLHAIARSLLQRERAGHTLQPTALVGELFLKLYQLRGRLTDDDHFFRLSARAMRQVLVDYGRGKRTAKRTGEAVPEALARLGRGQDLETAAAVKGVFARLKALDPGAAATVWMRAVEGMTLEEIREAQGREMWRVRADYDFGIEWMGEQLR